MLRPSVLNFLAMPTSVSPRLTVYSAKVGPGVGVGRMNEGVGVGPAGVGRGVGSAWAESAVGLRRLAGVGTQAVASVASRTAGRSHRTRIVGSIVTHLAPGPYSARQSMGWLGGSTGVGACSENSAARARPSAAVAM